MKNSIRRKALSVLLAFSMVLSVFQLAGVSAFAAEGTGVTAYYCDSGLFKDSNCTESNKIETDDYTYRADIAGIEFRGSVTSIGESAFSDCTKLQNMAIPAGVTSIGDYAFYGCIGLQNMAIPSGVTSIGKYVFDGCTGLTEIKVDADSKNFSDKNGVLFSKDKSILICYPAGKAEKEYSIPDGVTIIDGYAFSGCNSLTSVTIPTGITIIDVGTFAECTGLTAVTIPESVTFIGAVAFAGCTSLTGITIPEGLISIGSGAFSHCTSLTDAAMPDSVTTISDSAFAECTKLTNVVIPTGVTTIEGCTFADCTGLTGITIPEGVTSIGTVAFAGCTGLTAITIPESVTSIGPGAFMDCTGFINFTMPNVSSIGEAAFKNCKTVNLYCAESSTGWPKFVNQYMFAEDADTGSCVLTKYLGSSADAAIPGKFYGKTVTSIGVNAFADCTDLADITIPESITSIGAGAFGGCTGLTAVAIPAGVTAIGSNAFYRCTGLTCVTVGRNASVGQNAFKNCYCLKNLYVLGDAVPTGFPKVANVFYFKEKDDGTGYSYTNYSGTGVGRVIPKTLYGKDIDPDINENNLITEDAVAYCDGAKLYKNSDGTDEISWDDSYRSIISKIQFTSDTVTAIGEGVFRNCTGLSSVTIPAGVTSIGRGAFYNCTGLSGITIPAGVTSIGQSGFYGCSSLTGITIPKGVTSIGNDAFRNCTGLSGITIPEGVTSIGNGLFYGCTGLTGITIPKGVTSIGQRAFAGCTSLTQFGIDSANTAFAVSGGVLFSKDESTLICFPAGKSGTYAVPDSVTTICEGAFFTCESLTGVSFGSNSPLKVIDAGVFCNCGKLAAVTIPDNVTTIGASAFSRCAGLTDVSFGSGSHLSDIGQSAFSLCTGLTHVTIPAGVKNIGANAFANCTDLTAITIPAGVETIGNRAFNNCTGLTYVKFKGLVTSIGSEAFILESVTPTFYIPVEYHNDYVALLTENVTGSSSPNIADVVLVTAFDKLPADTEEQTVPVGTARSDLNLPDTLSATGNGSEELTINDVTWTENPAYEAHAAGTYLFTAKLPPNYELKDEGICPHITVKVAETGKAITSFAIGGNDCSINEVGHTIAVTVPYGTNVTALTPVIGVSKNASVSPASGIAQNFEKPVTYTVTAQNGDKQDYVVTVTVSTDTRNTGKKITSFAIGGNDCSINEANHTIAVTVPYRTNITALTPTITVSGKASVSPKSGIMQNFEKPVIYTVTAENGDTQNYVVTVTVSADTSHNSNQDNSKVNSSPTLPATVTDAPNGTAADLSGAAMPSGVTSVSLSTSQKSASDTSDQQAANAFRVAMTDTKLKVIGTPVIYDLKLLDQNGSAITGFTGKVKVKLPVPAGLRGMPHVLRYEESAGTFTDMNATVENGCLVFSTDHFSYYAVAGVGDSITLDTRNYQMSVGGNYQIGVKLTGNKAASVKIHSTNDKTATVTKLKNGNYQVNGKGTGTAYIMFDVYDNKNRLLTHASVKINVKEGSRPAGDSTRQIGVF